MPINKNGQTLTSITEENFERGVQEGIEQIIDVIRNVSHKYFKNGQYETSDMINFYLNIFANVLFSVHVQVLTKVGQNEIDKLMEFFSDHIMRIFLHQKESREDENKTPH